ncbi:hypothetical protein [Dactylosporangium sp. CA-233914]|uniref:hypothetical protein n=1 Tax=Dactylosporangium sp. CA-233914 TaxID=3239934 RepID=UPI003D9013DD
MRAAIWNNIALDASRFASWEPALDWIAPIDPDPIYENLYDRFWAIMADAAMLEHLAFAASYGDDDRFGSAAVGRLLAACRRWRPEADLRPDYGTVYATTRVLKAIAVGYDLVHERLSPAERDEIRDLLTRGAGRLADEWFSRPEIAGPVGIEPDRHSPHHSSVEWSAFGVIALCLLGDLPAADEWVLRTRAQFANHLLPGALGTDGAQVEGTAFWSSTVLSQIQFLDPLRRVTGVDLLTGAACALDLRTALAAYRPRRERSAANEPLYGESTGLSAVLFATAAERRDPSLFWLATLEPTAGRTEIWPAQTPKRREQMRFAPGGYAYAWSRAPLEPGGPPRLEPWHFPSIDETYLRTGWTGEDILVTIRSGRVTVHVGAELAFEDLTPTRVVDVQASREAGTGVYRSEPAGLCTSITETGRDGTVFWARDGSTDASPDMFVRLDVGERTVTIQRRGPWSRRFVFVPAHGMQLQVRRGTVVATSPDGHRPDIRPGYGLLDVIETDARHFPTVTVEPDADRIELTLAPVDGTGAG